MAAAERREAIRSAMPKPYMSAANDNVLRGTPVRTKLTTASRMINDIIENNEKVTNQFPTLFKKTNVVSNLIVKETILSVRKIQNQTEEFQEAVLNKLRGRVGATRAGGSVRGSSGAIRPAPAPSSAASRIDGLSNLFRRRGSALGTGRLNQRQRRYRTLRRLGLNRRLARGLSALRLGGDVAKLAGGLGLMGAGALLSNNAVKPDSSADNKSSSGGGGAIPNRSTVSGPMGDLLSFIAKGEGGYNSMNNGTSGGSIVQSTHDASRYLGKNLTDMTIAEIMQLQRGTRGTGRKLFAAGRYQIIPETMHIAVRDSGVGLNEKFTPAVQDRLGIALLTGTKRKVLASYLKGESNDINAAMRDAALEWASLPMPDTGRSAYGSGNKASHSVESVKRALMAARGAKVTFKDSTSTESPKETKTPASAKESQSERYKSTANSAEANKIAPTSLPVTVGGTMKAQGVSVAIGRLHPEFRTKLAAAIAEARTKGLNPTIFSAYRPPGLGVGGFGDKFRSLHAYGLAVDMAGIGRPGSRESNLWYSIATKHGLYNPYGAGHTKEWNHYQLINRTSIPPGHPLRQTITANGPKNLEQMWNAAKSTQGFDTSTVPNATPGTRSSGTGATASATPTAQGIPGMPPEFASLFGGMGGMPFGGIGILPVIMRQNNIINRTITEQQTNPAAAIGGFLGLAAGLLMMAR